MTKKATTVSIDFDADSGRINKEFLIIGVSKKEAQNMKTSLTRVLNWWAEEHGFEQDKHGTYYRKDLE